MLPRKPEPAALQPCTEAWGFQSPRNHAHTAGGSRPATQSVPKERGASLFDSSSQSQRWVCPRLPRRNKSRTNYSSSLSSHSPKWRHRRSNEQAFVFFRASNNRLERTRWKRRSQLAGHSVCVRRTPSDAGRTVLLSGPSAFPACVGHSWRILGGRDITGRHQNALT